MPDFGELFSFERNSYTRASESKLIERNPQPDTNHFE